MPDRNRHIVRNANTRQVHTVYVRDANWNWAQAQHSGGASGYIESLLTRMRKRDENRKLKSQLKDALREIARLKGLLMADGKDVSE